MSNQTASAVLVFHVSQTGNDQWNGQAATAAGDGVGPFATLEAARDRLRSLRKEGKLTGPVDVLVHAGRYELSQTIEFGPDDLGDETTPVTYRSAGDGTVILTGGTRLQGFQQQNENGVSLQFPPTSSPVQFGQLFFNGERQHLARYPNYDHSNPYGGGWLYVEGEIPNIYDSDRGAKGSFVCRDPRLKTWSTPNEVEVVVFPRYNWTNDIIRIETYDPETGEIQLSHPATYEIYPGDRFYFQNVREELTTPGEWFLDQTAQTLWFFPPSSLDDAIVEIPHLENVLVVDGGEPHRWQHSPEKSTWTDHDASMRLLTDPDIVQRGFLTFEGFTIEVCDGTGVVFENSRACRLIGCTVRNTGSFGVIVAGGVNCEVIDCDVYATGSGGIELSGGLRSPFSGTYLSCGHIARNNYVHHVGKTKKHIAGISLNGVGVSALHNLIHDAPRWGILSRGNNNQIEFNHIRHVNIETSDTAAIYLVDRDFSMRGTKIRYNLIHDILGYHRIDGKWRSPAYAFGIYLDDWTSGVEIRGNLTYRTPRGGMFINAGQDNHIENNMFLEETEELAYFHRWPPEMELDHCGTFNQGLRRNRFYRNIIASSKPDVHVYGFDRVFDENGEIDLATNSWDGNLIWVGDGTPIVRAADRRQGYRSHLTWEEWQTLGMDQTSVLADPLFVDNSADDFRLQPESPAFALGFEPLPIEQMGPQPSPYRPSWPIIEVEGAREFPLTPGNS